MQSFAALFKKYRLKSEFESLASFGAALAEEGRVYDDSILVRWQGGQRIPRDRTLLLLILKIFIQRGGITSFTQANEFLASTGLGYLTNQEQKPLSHYLENHRTPIPLELNLL